MQKDAECEKHLPELVQLYNIIFTKLNQEGDGIWARFNIVTGINISAFGGFAYFYINDRLFLCIAICVIGFFISLWSIYVLDKLWEWHQHWRDLLEEIESGFPKDQGWVQSYKKLPSSLKCDPGTGGCPLPTYTQPYLFLFSLAWIVLFHFCCVPCFYKILLCLHVCAKFN